MDGEERLADLEKALPEPGPLSSTEERPAVDLSARTDAPLGESWMSRIQDEIPMSGLTLPGTHDSAAFTIPWPFVATQRLDMQQQLNAGIRYLDLRCGLRRDVLQMVHGPQLLGLTLDEVLAPVYDWLAAHPTEGVIVQLKRDRTDDSSTMHFSQAAMKTISARPERWRTADTTPAMGELRGRIQLFRRFGRASLAAYGVDVTTWKDNPTEPFTIHAEHGTRITVQDHYRHASPEPLPSLVANKTGEVVRLLDEAAGDAASDHWYVNFTSALEFNWHYQIPPRQVAEGGWWGLRKEKGVNHRLGAILRAQSGTRRYGILAMDFPETTPGLISAAFMLNFERTAPSLRQQLPLALLRLVVWIALWRITLYYLYHTGMTVENLLPLFGFTGQAGALAPEDRP